VCAAEHPLVNPSLPRHSRAYGRGHSLPPEVFHDRPPAARARKNFSKSENFLLYGPCSLLPIEEPGSSQEMARK
jgi:hypothetical protein